MAVSLPTAADVRKVREQAAKSAAEQAETVKTPALAVLGAGEYAYSSLVSAYAGAKEKAAARAEAAQKFASDLPGEVDGFVATCRDLDLPVAGLMCIPPVDEEPALHFALLARFAERNGLTGLSMGMSADFETAIALGATHVRVGSAIFGARPAPA